GVDGCAANNGMSILEEIRSGYLMHRLNTPDNGVSGYDMLKLATMGGARVLGREKEIGSIELGKCADLILLTVNSLDLVGAYYDPMSILGTVGIKNHVDYTVVNGKVTVRDGKVVDMDEDKLIADANQEVIRFLEA
ncbi:MAG TPA: amidohydrolase family protein, partial [Fastidiosipila sp.]|nr:amidohydrolase family protein [Fastidiosipila sp.]